MWKARNRFCRARVNAGVISSGELTSLVFGVPPGLFKPVGVRLNTGL